MDASSTGTFGTHTFSPSSAVGAVAALWGISGVVLLLGNAVYRLAPRALEATRADLSTFEWVAFAAIVGFLAYTEGYKAFQLAFSPRVVARATYLARHPVWWHVVLAPAFCMGYFHARRKRMLVTWILTAGIIALIVLVRRLPMPWRGFIDAGVVIALSWGMLAILYFAFRALMGVPPPVPPDLPEVSEA